MDKQTAGKEGDKITLGILKAKGMAEVEAIEFIEGIRRGLKEIKEDKVRPWYEIKEEIGNGTKT